MKKLILAALATITAIPTAYAPPDHWTYMTWAATLSGYPEPRDLPAVEYVPEDWLQAKYCPGEECPVAGMYIEGAQVVFISSELPPDEQLGTLVHEFIHYLQFTNRPGMPRCLAEYEANFREWEFRTIVFEIDEPFVFAEEFYECKITSLSSD